MSRLERRNSKAREARLFGRLKQHQLRAAAEPRLPIRQMIGEQPSSSSELAGNFADLEALIEQLGTSPVYELGNPLPDEKHLPRRPVGSCPAAHNRALLDEEID